MNEDSPSAFLDLAEYARVIRTRKWWVVAVTATAVLVALIYSYLQTPMYSAEARILVRAVALSPLGPPARQETQVNLETEKSIVQSTAVWGDTTASIAEAMRGRSKVQASISQEMSTSSGSLVRRDGTTATSSRP